jgi:hypothetical protein
MMASVKKSVRIYRGGHGINTEATSYVENMLMEQGKLPTPEDVAEHTGCSIKEAQESIAEAVSS